VKPFPKADAARVRYLMDDEAKRRWIEPCPATAGKKASARSVGIGHALVVIMSVAPSVDLWHNRRRQGSLGRSPLRSADHAGAGHGI
jgi:hypothetical protein